MLTVLVLFVACGSEGFSDCSDAPCRADTVDAAYDQDADAVLAALPGLDPLEQDVLVSHLLEAYATDMPRICAAVPPDGPAGQRCSRARKRPHLALGEQAKQVREVKRRTAPGPAERHLPAPDLRLDVQPTTGSAEQAQEAARQGDARVAAGACLGGVPLGPERQECLFQAAEAVARARGTDGFAEAAPMCVAAGSFVTGCLQHTLVLALPPVPPADHAGRREITQVEAAITTIGQVVGPDLAPLYADQAWASWTHHAYGFADEVTGDLLAALPPEAAPHVRVAAAWKLLQGPALQGATFDEAVAALTAALAVQRPLVETAPHPEPVPLGKPRDFWAADVLPGEEAIPSAYCLGPGRRAVAEDARVDVQIAVLEAAARLPRPPAAGFFLAALSPDRPEWVRWTAARLSAELFPGLAAQRGITDPSALVTGRLQMAPSGRP